MKKLLVIQAAALGWEFVQQHQLTAIGEMELRPLQPVFPAVTCTAQATLRTALPPAKHNMIANGFFDRVLCKSLFWEQSAKLVSGARIWEKYRAAGGRVGMTFFQQSLGESVDFVISPAPIHKHSGSMIMSCASYPPSLYQQLEKAVGSSFKLQRYWGPLSSAVSSDWIAKANAHLLQMPEAPELLFVYLPGLDYDLQRFGPDHPRSTKALKQVAGQIALLYQIAREQGYEVVVYGDYAITNVTRPVILPNQILYKASFLKTRDIKGMLYPDLFTSRAFAVADHQVALVYCRDKADISAVAELLSTDKGIARIVNHAGQAELGVDSPRSGDLLLIAKPGAWFGYHWWSLRREAPDYATHVDIHNKPGFDPCELFFGINPMQISLNTSRLGGTHGLAGLGCEAGIASTLPLTGSSLLEIAVELELWLNQ